MTRDRPTEGGGDAQKKRETVAKNKEPLEKFVESSNVNSTDIED